jgi:hypothetical protein
MKDPDKVVTAADRGRWPRFPAAPAGSGRWR